MDKNPTKETKPTWTVEHWTEKDFADHGISTVYCSVCQTKIHTSTHVEPYLCSGCLSKVNLNKVINE
jgi:hypothetical protein